MKYKKIAIAGFAASMLAGAGTGLVLNIPGGASAASTAVTATTPDDTTDSATTDTATDSTDTATDSADDADDAGRPMRGAGLGSALAELVTAGTITQEQSDAIVAAAQAKHDAAEAAAEAAGTRPERGAFLTDSLTELVTAGTITQEQSDAIVAAIEANRPQGGPGGPGGFGGHGPGMGGDHGRGGMGGGMALETAATAIGITADELKTELDAGKTIADVATEKGVAVQNVIDAIVADRTADITQRVTDMVNGVAPTPPADDDAATDTTDDTTATTTG